MLTSPSSEFYGDANVPFFFFFTGVKEKRIIPVLIDEAYRYKIPRTISHITYLDYIRQSEDNFWELLCYSLTCDY